MSKAEQIKSVGIECRINEVNNDFVHRFHNLIADPNFINLCQRFEKNNLFNIVGRTQTENWHSSFLAWLLNPNGSHELEHFPLRCLLTSINVLAIKQENFSEEAKVLLLDDELIDTGEFSDTMVMPDSECPERCRERQVYYSHYHQDIKFDISLSTCITSMDNTKHRLVLICENKIKSTEGHAVADSAIPQTRMYADYWCKPKSKQAKCMAFYPINANTSSKPSGESYLYDKRNGQGKAREGHLALLFLSAKKDKSQDSRFVSMDYQTLYDYVLLPSLNHPNISPDAKKYLQEYIDLLEMKGYIESEERKELLSDIFENRKHKEVLCQYLSYKLFSALFPNDQNELNEYWAVYKKNIIGWLYYFAGKERFKVHQKKIRDLIPKGYDFFTEQIQKDQKEKVNVGKFEISIDGIDDLREAFENTVSSIYSINKNVLKYIKCIDDKYGDVIDYLIKKFADRNIKYECAGRGLVYKDLPISNIVALLQKESRDVTDYSYLADKLKKVDNNQYPLLYFQDDKNRHHAIYIKIGTTPSFVQKEIYDKYSNENKLDKCPWISGNKICKTIADKINPEKAANNYRWSQYLKVFDSTKGQLVAIPKETEDID